MEWFFICLFHDLTQRIGGFKEKTRPEGEGGWDGPIN